MSIVAQNNGYSVAQILARANGSDARWSMYFARLDYGFRLLGELGRTSGDSTVTEASIVMDADTKPIGNVLTLTRKVEASDFDPFNEYIQPAVWLHMGNDVPVAVNDGDRFAKFPQVIFKTVIRPRTLTEQGVEYQQIQAHDALMELLDADEIISPIILNPGDVITDKIKMILEMSPIPVNRWNVVGNPDLTIVNAQAFELGVVLTSIGDSFSNTLAASGTRTQDAKWESGTSLLTVVLALCDLINYIAFSDSSGVLNVRPWRNPALEAVSASYTDDRPEGILPEATVTQDIFRLPNHLTFESVPQGDQQVRMTVVAENLNINSPISKLNLRAPNGSPLIRHKVETGIEAVDQLTLQEKCDRRLLDLTNVPETYEWHSRLKPWHGLGDVVELTRSALGYSAVRFQVRKIMFGYQAATDFQMTLRRVLPLS